MPTATEDDDSHPVFGNMRQAIQDMQLSQEEQNLYSMHLNNLYGNGGVNNPDGSRSTLYQTVEQHEGKYYSIPTVWDGKREVDQWTNPGTGTVHDVANPVALANVDKIGWDRFPSSLDPQALDDRYMQMHSYMEKDTQAYFDSVSNTK